MSSAAVYATAVPFDVERDKAAMSDILARYADDSKIAYRTLPHVADVAYGPEPRQSFDYFPSATADSDKVFVFLHGGYWKAGSKEDRAFLAPPLVADGWHFLTVEYPLAPAARMAEIVDSVLACLRSLPHFLAENGIHNPRILLAGNSAGAHLVASAVAALTAADAVGPMIGGVVLLSGVYELEPMRRLEAQSWLRLSDSDVETYSPVRRSDFGGRRFVVAVGGSEAVEFHQQSLDFHRRLQSLGVDSLFMVVPGHGHFSIVGELGDLRGQLGLEVNRVLSPVHAR